jgi:hypothetical protein
MSYELTSTCFESSPTQRPLSTILRNDVQSKQNIFRFKKIIIVDEEMSVNQSPTNQTIFVEADKHDHESL